MSDKNDNHDNSESIWNRKTANTATTNINSMASKKSVTRSKQEMQQTNCDKQRDQQCRATIKHNSSNNNNAKCVDSIHITHDTQLPYDNDISDEMNENLDENANNANGDQSATNNKKRKHYSNKNFSTEPIISEDTNNHDSNESETKEDMLITNADETANTRATGVKKKPHEENESSKYERYKCPVCDLKLDSQHTFTIHIRQHNPSDHSHTCRLCGKTLSSASSLDRHMLIHSGERPFKCRICNMAFTTNGNMHRHMRTHGMEVNDDSNVSDGNNYNSNSNNKLIKSKKKKVSEDDANNETESKSSPKRRNSDSEETCESGINLTKEANITCPICNKQVVSKSALHSHMENHPNDPICCQDCGMILNNYATYTQHRCTATSEGDLSLFNANKMNFSTAPPIGFFDLSFTDFSSRKFSIIAKSFCEHNLRKASSPYHDFECDKCHRAFPCGSALNLHQSSHNSETYCVLCHVDFATPALLVSHQLKHRYDFPLSYCSTIPQPHGFIPPTAGHINGLHNNSYGEVPQSDKEDFLALLDLQNKGSQFASLQSNYKFIRHEDPFENSSYFVHAKPLPSRPTTFQPKIITNNSTDGESGKHDLADIQSIISVTSSATPLISSIRSSPPAASPASPVQLAISGAHPDSPVAADSANASPNTPSSNNSVKAENDAKQIAFESNDSNNEKTLSIVEDDDETKQSFKCERCTLVFKSSNALKRHNRGHTVGGHSYACHLCPYTSLDKSTLVRHLRTHNGERPFQCAICKYAFTTKANCERHVKKRHKKLDKTQIRNAMQYNPNMTTASSLTNQNIAKPESSTILLSPNDNSFPGGFDTVCKYCNVDFKYNRVLRHHLRSLHNSCSHKPYCCTICKLGFSTKNNCIRHVVKQHPEMKEKLSSVVIANASSVTTSDHSESESMCRDSPGISSQHTNESLNASSDNSMKSVNMSSDASTPMPQHSSLAALCQIANSISTNSENSLNLCLEDKNKNNDDNTDTGNSSNEDQPLNLASHNHEEPLDLAVHALDLSRKSSYSVKDICSDEMKNMNEAVRNAASSLLALRSMAATNVFPTGGLLANSSLFHPTISLTPPLPAHSSPSVSVMSPGSCTSMEDIYKVTTFRISKNRLMPRNERSFTCAYCSAGFTLKSNMERHIKRKHPEYARPPRSRGGSAAAQQNVQTNSSSSASLLSKSNNATLSSKTRAALRVVLNNKVLGSSSGTANINNSRPSSPLNVISKLSEDNNSIAGDNNGGDLASVSSLIDHSANSSNALKQYFDKNNDDIESNVNESINTINTTISETIRPLNAVNDKSPRRRAKESSGSNKSTEDSNGKVVTKKRSAYTDSPNSVSCPYCARKFPWTSSLRRHILTHTGLKPYKCPKCPILFTTKSNCERHLVRKHNGREKRNVETQLPVASQDGKPYKCNICTNSTFSTQGNLRKHYYLRHWTKPNKSNSVLKPKKSDKTEDETNETNQTIPNEDETNERQVYKCYVCEASFNGRHKCLLHIQSCHSNEYETLQQKGAIDKVPINDSKLDLDVNGEDYEPYGQEKIFCVFCPRQFLSIVNLRNHMRVHLGERPFKCSLCPKKFSLKNSLLRHYRTNHPDSFVSSKSKAKCKIRTNSEIQSTSLIKETECETPNKSVKPKRSCNSLLYLIPKDEVVKQSASVTYAQTANSLSYTDTGDGSDLIQNLLGIQDSKMLDEMLDSADSAARILGVKDAL